MFGLNQKKIILFLIILLASLLRFFYLTGSPPALYSDEINQAYNAYSILKTGKDEHSNFLPVSLRSFGDWKPPLQTYLMIPTIVLFGLTELAVRIPNALLGALSVYLIYLLVLELFVKNKEKMALLTAFLLAISPWHLHQSRSAMLVLPALFFFMLGIYFLLKSFKKTNFLSLSSISFVLSMYAYYGMRLVVPLFLLVIFVKYANFFLVNYKTTLKSFFLGLFLLLPLIGGFLNEPNVIFGRAKNVSIFFDPGVRLRSGELQTEDGVMQIKPIISLFFHNKPYLYFLDILKRFLVHLDGQFLFLKGDIASPFRIPRMGVLFLVEAVLFPLGLFCLINNKAKFCFLIISWLVIAFLPASLTFLTPAHNRSFNAVIPLMILSAYGILNLLSRIKVKNLIVLTLCVVYMISLNFYLVSFYKILPQHYGADWLYGFKQLVSYINATNAEYAKVIFLPKTGMSYIYLLFYNHYPPELYQKEAVHNYIPDNLGFEYVKSFNKYIFFTKERPWEVLSHQMEKGEMYIGREEEIPKDAAKHEILYPDGKVAFRITYKDY